MLWLQMGMRFVLITAALAKCRLPPGAVAPDLLGKANSVASVVNTKAAVSIPDTHLVILFIIPSRFLGHRCSTSQLPQNLWLKIPKFHMLHQIFPEASNIEINALLLLHGCQLPPFDNFGKLQEVTQA